MDDVYIGAAPTEIVVLKRLSEILNVLSLFPKKLQTIIPKIDSGNVLNLAA